jgi:two-component system phosphate regulon sensor histidine kinase PhoR
VRQDFVANVSHELRTPLTSIKGYTETLLAESQPPPEVLSSFLEVILKNTNHMVKMVDDLLQLARIEAGREVFESVRVDPTEALMAAWMACQPIAQGKQVSLANHIPPEGIKVWADSDQLIRVFRNLLENAIRYSPEGGAISVDCSLEAETVTIGVRNEGPSIAKYHQQRIFERFYRIEKTRGGDFGGTGLGLAICRHIILNHGGLIWVQSPNPGRTDGATFYFTLMSAEER